MSQSHLDDLARAIERAGWTIAAKSPGTGDDISETWTLSRPWDEATLTLNFEGADDLETLPVEKAYACSIAGRKGGWYFGHRLRSWPAELAEFETFLRQTCETEKVEKT